MNAIEAAFKKAGFEIEEKQTCWGCGELLPDESWYWLNDPSKSLFCSYECLTEHPLEDEKIEEWPIVKTVKVALDAWGLPYDRKFFSPDGLVVTALLCNAAAKFIGEEYYDYKPTLIEAACKIHSHVWKNDDVVYFETCVGQLSFHVFEESPIFDLLPAANGRHWRGGWMQDEALSLALAFLGDGDDELEYSCRKFLSLVQGW